jgi:hypothetical protein
MNSEEQEADSSTPDISDTCSMSRDLSITSVDELERYLASDRVSPLSERERLRCYTAKALNAHPGRGRHLIEKDDSARSNFFQLFHRHAETGDYEPRVPETKAQRQNVEFIRDLEKSHLPPEPVLIPLVQSSDELAVADFRNKGLGDTLVTLAVSNISKTISAEAESRILDISGNRLTANGMVKIMLELDKNDELELDELHLGNNHNIGKNAAWLPILSSYLGHSLSLRRLALQSTRLGDANVLRLCAALEEQGSVLTALNLSDNKLTSAGATALAISLQTSFASLGELSIGWNDIGPAGALALWRALDRAGSKVHSLLMPWNSLGTRRAEFVQPAPGEQVEGAGRGRGARAAVPAAMAVTCADAVGALAKALGTNKELTHLDISFNRIGPAECSVLAKTLATNHTLIGLHVEGNACVIDAEGFLHPLPPPALGPDATLEALGFVRAQMPARPARSVTALPVSVPAQTKGKKGEKGKKGQKAKGEGKEKEERRGKGSSKGKPKSTTPKIGKEKGAGSKAAQAAALEEERKTQEAKKSRWIEQLYGRAGNKAAAGRMALGHINLVESGKYNEWALAVENVPRVKVGEMVAKVVLEEAQGMGEEAQQAGEQAQQQAGSAASRGRTGAISTDRISQRTGSPTVAPRRHRRCSVQVCGCMGLAGADVGSASDPYALIRWNGSELSRSQVVNDSNDPIFEGLGAEFDIGDVGGVSKRGVRQTFSRGYDENDAHAHKLTLTLTLIRTLTLTLYPPRDLRLNACVRAYARGRIHLLDYSNASTHLFTCLSLQAH